MLALLPFRVVLLRTIVAILSLIPTLEDFVESLKILVEVVMTKRHDLSRK